MKTLDFNEYEEFIEKLELIKINMIESESELRPSFSPPAEINVDESSEYKNHKKDKKITVFYTLCVKAKQKYKSKHGMQIKAKYKLIYNTEQFLNDELFEHFKSNEVRIQLWPYFREYVNHMTYYMGLPPLVLNLLKVKYGFKE